MNRSKLVICCALLVSGCASVGPDACAKTDWYQQGYTDGRRSWYSRIDEHASRCAAAGVKPDAAEYVRGLNQGQIDQRLRPSGA